MSVLCLKSQFSSYCNYCVNFTKWILFMVVLKLLKIRSFSIYFSEFLPPSTVNPRYMNSKSTWNVVLNFIFKCITAVILPRWSAQKESCWDFRSFKGLNTMYENISKNHCRVISFLIFFKKLFFIFSSR